MNAHPSNQAVESAGRRLLPVTAHVARFPVPVPVRRTRLQDAASSPGHYLIRLRLRHAVRARTFGRQWVVTES